MEPLEGMVKNEVLCSDDFNEEFLSISEDHETAEYTEATPAIETNDLITADKMNLKKTAGFEHEHHTLHTFDVTSDEEENRSNKPEVSPTISKHTQNTQNEVGRNKYRCDLCGATFEKSILLEDHHTRHLEVKEKRSTQCHICFKSYKLHRMLESHLAKHTGCTKFECDVCGCWFIDKTSLKMHRRSHLRKTPHKCTSCKRVFLSSRGLRTHINSAHNTDNQNCSEYSSSSNDDNGEIPNDDGGKNRKSAHVDASSAPYTCHICSKTYSIKKTLKIHLNTHTTRFKCEQCDKRMQSADHLKQHMKVHLRDKEKRQEVRNRLKDIAQGASDEEENMHKCDFCEATFTEPSLLEYHRNLHLKVKNHEYLQCHICFKAFQSRGALRQHRIKHTPRYKCKHCSKTFGQSRHLKEHVKQHQFVTQKCVFCTKTFSSPSDLMKHTNRVHKVELERDGYGQKLANNIPVQGQTTIRNKANDKTPCDDTGILNNAKAKNTEESISDHEEEIIPHYECLICSSVFASRHGLDQHLVKHTRRFECEHCSQTFSYVAHLEQHLRRHLGIKTHQCTECKAAFTCSTSLKKHMIHVHTEREHKCNVCGRQFFKKSSLDDHKNKHLRRTPHKCSFCPVAFSSISSLMRHTNNNHKSKKQLDGKEQNLSRTTFEAQTTGNEVENREANNSIPVIPRSPPYICPICTKVYSVRHSLLHHLIQHTNRFKCEHCEKRFTSAAHLKKHMVVHLRMKKNTKAKKRLPKDSQTEESDSDNKPLKIRNAESIVQMEVQESVFKDAISLEHEREFKPIIEISEEVYIVSDFGVEQPKKAVSAYKSQIVPYQTGENDLLEDGNVGEGISGQMEKSKLPEGGKNLPSIFRPLRVNLMELQDPSS